MRLGPFGIVAVTCLLAGACSEGSPSSRPGQKAASPSPASPPADVESPQPENEPGKARASRLLEITVGHTRLTATLNDSMASDDLLRQLPLTVSMSDFGSVEKVGELPQPLSTEGAPPGADPDVGDLGYYAPYNDLVLYYRDQRYHNGIVILGKMQGNVADIEQYDEVSVRVELAAE